MYGQSNSYYSKRYKRNSKIIKSDEELVIDDEGIKIIKKED